MIQAGYKPEGRYCRYAGNYGDVLAKTLQQQNAVLQAPLSETSAQPAGVRPARGIAVNAKCRRSRLVMSLASKNAQR